MTEPGLEPGQLGCRLELPNHCTLLPTLKIDDLCSVTCHTRSYIKYPLSFHYSCNHQTFFECVLCARHSIESYIGRKETEILLSDLQPS